jgi:hypothetical protein
MGVAVFVAFIGALITAIIMMCVFPDEGDMYEDFDW